LAGVDGPWLRQKLGSGRTVVMITAQQGSFGLVEADTHRLISYHIGNSQNSSCEKVYMSIVDLTITI